MEQDFADETFDKVVLVGTLGAVDAPTRNRIIEECVRVLKSGGEICLCELAMKHGDEEHEEMYRHHAQMTGEMGSRVVRDPYSRKVLFVAKHFEPEELEDLLSRHGIFDIQLRKENIVKDGLIIPGRERREQISAWGKKPSQPEGRL